MAAAPWNVTLWNDPADCGLRMEVGVWPCPRDAHASNGVLFPRVTVEHEEALRDHLGEDAPQSPGEVAHVAVPAVLAVRPVERSRCSQCGAIQCLCLPRGLP